MNQWPCITNWLERARAPCKILFFLVLHLPYNDIMRSFPHGSEVRFDCLPSEYVTTPEPTDEDYFQPDRKKDNATKPVFRSWKIKCEDGEWRGEPMTCDDEGNAVDEEANKSKFNASCPFGGLAAEHGEDGRSRGAVVAFFGDRELNWTREERFEPGVELVFRCVDIGEKQKSAKNSLFVLVLGGLLAGAAEEGRPEGAFPFFLPRVGKVRAEEIGKRLLENSKEDEEEGVEFLYILTFECVLCKLTFFRSQESTPSRALVDGAASAASGTARIPSAMG